MLPHPPHHGLEPTPSPTRRKELRGIPVWLPDGKHIVVSGRRGSEPSRGFVVDVASGSAKTSARTGLQWEGFGTPPCRLTASSSCSRTRTGRNCAGRSTAVALPIPGLLASEEPLGTEDGAALFSPEVPCRSRSRAWSLRPESAPVENDRAERRRRFALYDGDDQPERQVLDLGDGELLTDLSWSTDCASRCARTSSTGTRLCSAA